MKGLIPSTLTFLEQNTLNERDLSIWQLIYYLYKNMCRVPRKKRCAARQKTTFYTFPIMDVILMEIGKTTGKTFNNRETYQSNYTTTNLSICQSSENIFSYLKGLSTKGIESLPQTLIFQSLYFCNPYVFKLVLLDQII